MHSWYVAIAGFITYLELHIRWENGRGNVKNI